MSVLLDQAPYSARDDHVFLAEMNALTEHHLRGCEAYRRIWPDAGVAQHVADLPYLHVGLFKHIDLRTTITEGKHLRTLLSSATSSGQPSQIALDTRSSELQSRSSISILKDFIGDEQQPLCILDSAAGLRGGRRLPARTAAAMSLKPLASQMHFLMNDADDPRSLNWGELLEAVEGHDAFMVYGFTWILWQAWACATMPADAKQAIRDKRVTFVHSGGWKKLETERVDRHTFDSRLTDTVQSRSQVVDFYGLVEQVGILYPLCPCGYRIAPAWADVLVRDPVTHECAVDRPGQLQFMNTISWGAPYHNVITEDLGRIVSSGCRCGRNGTAFELIGRIPNAEVRGCANV